MVPGWGSGSGEIKVEFRPAILVLGETDAALIGDDDFAGDRESQAHAFDIILFRRSIETFKDSVLGFLWNSRAFVRNGDPNPVRAFPSDTENDLTPVRGMFERVGEEIVDDFSDSKAVSVHWGKVFLILAVKANLLLRSH
jgi:hypothetical protein